LEIQKKTAHYVRRINLLRNRASADFFAKKNCRVNKILKK